ncbi:MAG TPA: biotin--[acetyl-CoA-carboxylase] ligase [Candidatus Avidehalobacter gallistercoris]|uniref:Bifunctional ligase/repressor BirA n=1 Tax=Candidatus Avidehalobacter gallistercoris TaxID=2840694 RepID=A0A9D1KX89_9FIRM|nr:biotin--[acetyl-CoA-carboxylase] ligase [Candidatus Avidehalobacter gallistercoris]
MAIRDDIFALLYAADDYVSGEQISEKLGISRAAVWKHVQALEQEGYTVEAVRRKGYRLLPNGIRAVEIEPYLQTKWLGREYQYLTEVDSTNIYCKSWADKGAPHGAMAAADLQTAGRGRLGRAWSSPPGSGVWFSLVLRPNISPDRAPQISLATAVGVAAGLRELGYDAGIKWPNDIYIGGRKVCGMLTEMRGSMESVEWVVVGIGINCLNKELPPEIKDIATTLALASDKPVVRAEVLAMVLNKLEYYYSMLADEGFADIRREWLANNITLGKRVNIRTLNETFFGEALDMTEDGSLLVKREGGGEYTLVTGDVFFA